MYPSPIDCCVLVWFSNLFVQLLGSLPSIIYFPVDCCVFVLFSCSVPFRLQPPPSASSTDLLFSRLPLLKVAKESQPHRQKPLVGSQKGKHSPLVHLFVGNMARHHSVSLSNYEPGNRLPLIVPLSVSRLLG